MAEILRVDAIALVLESAQTGRTDAIRQMSSVLRVGEPGFVDGYLTQGRGGHARQVTLRQVQDAPERVFGEAAGWVRSEACLRLDLGTGRLPGMLALGAEDPHQFTPQHGTDLLAFFAGVFERSMRHWLS